MYTNSSSASPLNAIEIIEDMLGITLSSSQRNLVTELEKNQDAFCESIYKMDVSRNQFTVALEAIYYLFFYDFDTKTQKIDIDKYLLVKLQQCLQGIPSSMEIKKSEIIFQLVKYIDDI